MTTQAIKLPENIVGGIGVQAMWKEINIYASEVARVTVILTHNFFDKLLKERGSMGYMDCVDLIQTWAIEFVNTFAYVEEWEAWIDSDENPYKKDTSCWDDVIVRFGFDKLKSIQK
jgi:hypothetical protein